MSDIPNTDLVDPATIINSVIPDNTTQQPEEIPLNINFEESQALPEIPNHSMEIEQVQVQLDANIEEQQEGIQEESQSIEDEYHDSQQAEQQIQVAQADQTQYEQQTEHITQQLPESNNLPNTEQQMDLQSHGQVKYYEQQEQQADLSHQQQNTVDQNNQFMYQNQVPQLQNTAQMQTQNTNIAYQPNAYIQQQQSHTSGIEAEQLQQLQQQETHGQVMMNNNINQQQQYSQGMPLVEQVQPNAYLQQQQQSFEPVKMLSPDELNLIYNEFKVAIRNFQIEKVSSILKKYQKIHDLANKIDTQTRQISTYIAVNLSTDDETYAMLKLLIENGAKPLFKDHLNQSILFYIAKDGKMKSLALLLDHGCDVNELDTNGQSPLFFAARDNQIEMVKELIAKGADAYQIDKMCGQTALFYAARNGNLEIINILVHNGCKVNHLDTMKKQAKHFATRFSTKETVNLLQEHMNKAKMEEGKAKEIPPKKQTKQVLKEVAPSNVAAAAAAAASAAAAVAQAQQIQNNQTNDTASQSAEPTLQSQDSKKIVDPKGRNRKPMKDQAKMSYKLVYTDENGQQRELSRAEYMEFKSKYPDVTRILENADEMISEDVYGKEKDSWEKVAKKILQTLAKVKGCYLFQQPVDVVRYKIDDYYDIVKRPMDFGTIKNKLNSNVYGNCKEFLEDSELVFYNCVLYNGSDSEVGKICLTVKQEFKRQCYLYDVYQYLSPEQIEQFGGEQQQNGAKLEARALAIASMQTQQVINNNQAILKPNNYPTSEDVYAQQNNLPNLQQQQQNQQIQQQQLQQQQRMQQQQQLQQPQFQNDQLVQQQMQMNPQHQMQMQQQQQLQQQQQQIQLQQQIQSQQQLQQQSHHVQQQQIQQTPQQSQQVEGGFLYHQQQTQQQHQHNLLHEQIPLNETNVGDQQEMLSNQQFNGNNQY